MNYRENYEALISHQETEWVPNATTEVAIFDGQLEYWENGPIEGGFDGFGCRWLPTESAGGQPALDIIPEIHICGYCTDIIPDIIEEGSVAWHSAQPMNDLEAIIQEYGDRLAIIGGYDTQGRAASPDVPDEVIIAEVDRCIDTYGRFGKAYGFFGFLLGDFSSPENIRKHDLMFAECAKRAGAPQL